MRNSASKTAILKNAVIRAVEKACEKNFGAKPKKIKLEYPSSAAFGDFSVACFDLEKQFNKKAAEIAQKLASLIKAKAPIAETKAIGPYLNFTIKRKVFFEAAFKKTAFSKPLLQGRPRKKRIMIEYLSPNTNKPLHLGHLRNGVIGMALARIFENQGLKVIKANLINDRGIHICKSMLAWRKWANNADPKSAGLKGDHFVGSWYVRWSKEAEKNPGLEDETRQMLKKWEEGDKETLALWKKMNDWVYQGFAETCKKLGLEFDVVYYESQTYKLGRKVAATGLKKGIFQKNGEQITAELPVEEFGTENGEPKKITLVRTDGTTVYITQDLGTAKLKFDDFNLDISIILTGTEQEYHFKCLFALLKMLGFAWVDKFRHASYGMVLLPSGKMKSREGNAVNADDLISQMTELALLEIKKRETGIQSSEKELAGRAEKIALAAIKFYLLRVAPKQKITFNPQESISLNGFTGPYCQYSYARTSGILKKAGRKTGRPDFSLLGNKEELGLGRLLMQFPEELGCASSELNPSRLCLWVFSLAQAFNQFYNQHPILEASPAGLLAARLELVKTVRAAIKKGLNLLSIEVLEKM